MTSLDPGRLIHLEAAGPVPAWYLAGALRGVATVLGQQGGGDDLLVRVFVAYLTGRPLEVGEGVTPPGG